MGTSSNGVALHLSADVLRPLITDVVREVLAQQAEASAKLPDRLCYSEAEAAALLGLERHQLRDTRRRGEIAASVVCGRRVRYSRDDLVEYLAKRRTAAK